MTAVKHTERAVRGRTERGRTSLLRASAPGVLCLLLLSPAAFAAKPGGGGGSNSTATSAAPPELYGSEMNYADRALTVQGLHLIGGDSAAPELPEVRFGGRVVAIDGTASVAAMDFATGEGALIVPFDAILAAHPELVESTLFGDQIPGGDNFAIRVVTAAGSVASSLYVAEAVQESLAPPPPPSTGSCPCTPYYDQYYEALYALLWPTCTAPQSSNLPNTGPVPVEQYIEASYIDELTVIVIAAGSDSSTSPRSTLAGTCHVRTGDYWPLPEQPSEFLEAPIPVSDEDHLACVAELIAREPICRGGNWLDP